MHEAKWLSLAGVGRAASVKIRREEEEQCSLRGGCTDSKLLLLNDWVTVINRLILQHCAGKHVHVLCLQTRCFSLCHLPCRV